MESKYVISYSISQNQNWKIVYDFELLGVFYMNVEEQLDFVFNVILEFLEEEFGEISIDRFKALILLWSTNGVDTTILEFEKWN